MSANTATIFISAVTDEFKSYRDAVTKWLDRPGVRIETQEKFFSTGVTMLVRLSDYIHECDAVVHLVGDRTGNESGSIVEPAVVQCLLEAHRDLLHCLGLTAGSISRLSYTQWEAWLAIYHKKRLFIAVPEATAPRDTLLKDEVKRQAQSEDQMAHIAALAERGRYPEIRFANSDQLCLGLLPLRDILISGARNELGLTNIISLSEYRASLAGFRRFLSSINLPFQAPPHGNPCHPEELLKTLETSVDARGVLLAGAGGVGKTRTTFETAQLADSRDWRVIYVLPGQPAVSAEKVVEAVLAHGAGKTMVVIEYLDQMQELDLGALRRHLIQTSAQRGIQFGLMANCRPGFLLKIHPEREATFDTVTLVPTAQEAQTLSRYVAVHSAPRALDSLGEPELVRLCGHRPIISLLVAQQLEQLAGVSSLQPGEFTAVRAGDLAHWLRRRLAEDGLVVPQAESIWDTASPPPHLVAAAAALGCAPDEDAALTAGAASALRAIGTSDSTAARITAVLVAVGWLERDGPWLHVVHDVVADELAEQCIFGLEGIRQSELHALLSPALTRARSFGRLAKTFTRVQGALSDQRASMLRSALERWLKDVARKLGETLADDDASHGSYALGAVLGGSAFEDLAIEEWSTLVIPWLTKHRTSYEARHLLFRGLRSHHPKIADLIPIAVTWLERWRNGQSASFVFGPLLRVIGPGAGESRQLVDWSLVWLHRFTDKQEAEFVFHTLLARADLRGELATEAVTLALQWLADFIDKQEAEFVLGPLLEREELKGEAATQAMTLALHWLTIFHDKRGAGFVLPPLLGRVDLKGEPATRAMRLALQWLADFTDNPGARYVLPALLGRADLEEQPATQAVTLALQWLTVFTDNPRARFVLAALLERVDLKGEAVTLALQWLAHFTDSVEAGYVLAPLLDCADLKGESAKKAIVLALQWLARFADNAEARFVLAPLLECAELKGEAATQAMMLALQWLTRFTEDPGTRYVLPPLLRRADLKEEAATRAVMLALRWLADFTDNPEAGYVLTSLLWRADLKGEAATQAVTQALRWLANFTDNPEAGYVLARLLERADSTGEAAMQATTLALRWLAKFPATEGAGFVLKRTLERTDLKGESAVQAVTLALQWLYGSREKSEAGYVLTPLLGRAPLKGEAVAQAITLALEWLAGFTDKAEAQFVFHSLLARVDLKGEAATRATTLALEWLTGFADRAEAQFVFNSLLARADLKGEAAMRAMMLALQWLADFSHDPGARYVLTPLLGRGDLKGEPAMRAMTLALQWLTGCTGKLEARFVLAPLLGRGDLKGETATQAITLAVEWLTDFATKAEAGFVLAPLLGRSDLGEVATRTVRSALLWAESFSHHEKAGFVLVELCLGTSATEISDELKDLMLAWADNYKTRGGGAPALVLRIFALRSDAPDAKKIVMSALAWLRSHDRNPFFGHVLLALLKKQSMIDGVLDVTIAAALNAGWNAEIDNVRKPLLVALELLPPDDSRRDEIEALLQSDD